MRLSGLFGLVAICVLALAVPRTATAAPADAAAPQKRIHARLDFDRTSFEIHPDLTYVETLELDYTLLTPRGLRERERSALDYYPDSQSLEVLEAWVTQPDGSRLVVGPSQIFTRPSAATQDAPGFTGSLTTTVLYPQLREGSRTHIIWRLTQKVPPLLGVSVWSEPPFEWPMTHGEVDITAPADLNLPWRARGGFKVSDTVTDGTRHVVATLDDTQGDEAERYMVSTSDFQPMFLMTSLHSLQEIGAIYYRQSHDRVVVTPRIADLAASIVGADTGVDAARDIYDWVATNIRYVAVFLNPNDGYVPHPSDQVLANGFGDCKDHVVLMQALLAARGIRAEAALIDWGTRTKDLPLWTPSQFNHAIVYLPDFDLFANPTDPYARFDALDRRLSGKTVVVATPEGEVRTTPPSGPQTNRYALDSEIRMLPDGTLQGEAHMHLSASLDSGMRSAVANAATSRDLVDRLLAYDPEGGSGALTTSNPRDLAHPFDISATWTSPHGVTFQGPHAYMTVPAGIDVESPARLRQYLSPSGKRRHGLLANSGDYRWTTSITLPATVSVISLPPDIDFSNAAGSYAVNYTRTANVIGIERHLVIARNVYEPSEYPDLEALLYQPIDDARAAIVLDREETAGR
jgi:transglutaminase-like putative cysteine protease